MESESADRLFTLENRAGAEVQAGADVEAGAGAKRKETSR